MVSLSQGSLVLIVAAFVAAALVAFAGTPVAAWVARRIGAIDRPGAERRVHDRPVPRAGGLAVAVAFVGVGLVVTVVASGSRLLPDVESIGRPEIGALFAGALVAAALGLVDDRYDLRPRWQFAAQLALAAGAIVSGVLIDSVNNPVGTGPIVFVSWFAVAFTGFWIVGMINSINWIDGLDGLSSGVALIAVLTLGAISLTPAIDEPAVSLLCAVLAGALAGFLPWNFHPARIFIGTTGVYLIGYTLAVLSILGTAKVAVALLVLGVPIIDSFWIIVRRLLAGRSPLAADRGHLHHRLLDLGLTHRGAVLTIYLLCGVLAVLSLVLSGTGQLYAFLSIVVVGGVVLYLLTRASREALEAESYEAEDEPAGEGPGR